MIHYPHSEFTDRVAETPTLMWLLAPIPGEGFLFCIPVNPPGRRHAFLEARA